MLGLRYHSRVSGFILLAVCCLLFCCSVFGQQTHALKTDISPREAFYLTEVVPPESSMDFIFEMDKGVTIDVRVVDEKNNDLKYWEDANEGTFRIDAGEMAKTFTVIFDNSESLFSSKAVTFHFHEHINKQNKFDSSQMDPIECGVGFISETIDNMFKYQIALRRQQRLHRETIETSNVRVLVWAIFQIVTLIIMSFSQIFFLKRFLEKKNWQ
ncbi:unnamed protein product [Phytomonas sp. EM1]|nr:unnamed protein product [Phytomonas sp. EM1]|eukprot:CCW65794.1 unnamed protein product [Phytomonas sp. isolate EM1]